MRFAKNILVIFMGATVVACGGASSGSGSGGGGNVASGTASQYFSKNAVGNTWTHIQTIIAYPNVGANETDISSYKRTVTSSTAGVITISDAHTSGTPPVTTTTSLTSHIDESGALVFSDGSTLSIALPPSFAIGTTWVEKQATASLGSVNSKISAINVTRTVPAGTFNDCLQIDTTRSDPDGTKVSYSTFVSPSIGTTSVDFAAKVTYVANGGGTFTVTRQLQPGFIANP